MLDDGLHVMFVISQRLARPHSVSEWVFGHLSLQHWGTSKETRVVLIRCIAEVELLQCQ